MEKEVKVFYSAEKSTTLNEQHRNLTRHAPTQVHAQTCAKTSHISLSVLLHAVQDDAIRVKYFSFFPRGQVTKPKQYSSQA